MATIGVSKPYVAKYGYDELTQKVSYTAGVRLAKAVEFSAEIESGDDSNNLFADNGVAESDKSFSGGNMTITTDDLEPTGSAMILGIALGKVTVGEEEADELVYDDDAQAPYLGFGCIIKKKHNNLYKWRAVVFTKVMFSVPSDAATTQGESIEWQTTQLSAIILRDDSSKHTWKREATFASETAAEGYIKQMLQIGTEESL